MINSRRPKCSLEIDYRERYQHALKPIAMAIERQLFDYLSNEPRIDRVASRAKDVGSFLKKASKKVDGKLKYSEPLDQIQDQIGARIVTFFNSDVERVSRVILKYFRFIEQNTRVPDSEWEFGYFGKHYVLIIPNELIGDDIDRTLTPQFFELQIKTLFQHAWSEAEHDIGYKPSNQILTSDQKRRLAFTSAQAWGADRAFDELFKELGN